MGMIIKFKDFIKEEADYRNVTGYGSMGTNDPQNAGPSFNKGPDAHTYYRPDVIGVEKDTISDPYFAAQRTQKMKRIKKNRRIEKNRKNKSKYLDKMDKKTQNKLIESVDYYKEKKEKRKKELEKIKKILPLAYLSPKFFDNQGNVLDWEIICNVDDFANAPNSFFAGNAFDSLDDFKDMVQELKDLGADDIKVGGIQLDEGPYSDTLYFRNIDEDVLKPPPPEEGDLWEGERPWAVSPDELDCWDVDKNTSKEMAKVSDEYEDIDPYGEEEWNDNDPDYVKPKASNQWRAWWD
jgi:hypothetical protein